MNANVTINGKQYEYPVGTAYEEIAREHQKDYEWDIVLVSADKRLRELNKKLSGDCELTFFTTADPAGYQAYRRSLTLMLMKAVYKVAGNEAVHRAQGQDQQTFAVRLFAPGQPCVDHLQHKTRKSCRSKRSKDSFG